MSPTNYAHQEESENGQRAGGSSLQAIDTQNTYASVNPPLEHGKPHYHLSYPEQIPSPLRHYFSTQASASSEQITRQNIPSSVVALLEQKEASIGEAGAAATELSQKIPVSSGSNSVPLYLGENPILNQPSQSLHFKYGSTPRLSHDLPTPPNSASQPPLPQRQQQASRARISVPPFLAVAANEAIAPLRMAFDDLCKSTHDSTMLAMFKMHDDFVRILNIERRKNTSPKQLEQQFKAMLEEMDSLRKALARAQLEQDLFREEAGKMNEKNERLRAENEVLKKEVEEGRGIIGNMERQIDKLNQEFLKLRGEKEKLEIEKQVLSLTMTKLKDPITTSSSDHSSLSGRERTPPEDVISMILATVNDQVDRKLNNVLEEMKLGSVNLRRQNVSFTNPGTSSPSAEPGSSRSRPQTSSGLSSPQPLDNLPSISRISTSHTPKQTRHSSTDSASSANHGQFLSSFRAPAESERVVTNLSESPQSSTLAKLPSLDLLHENSPSNTRTYKRPATGSTADVSGPSELSLSLSASSSISIPELQLPTPDRATSSGTSPSEAQPGCSITSSTTPTTKSSLEQVVETGTRKRYREQMSTDDGTELDGACRPAVRAKIKHSSSLGHARNTAPRPASPVYATTMHRSIARSSSPKLRVTPSWVRNDESTVTDRDLEQSQKLDSDSDLNEGDIAQMTSANSEGRPMGSIKERVDKDRDTVGKNSKDGDRHNGQSGSRAEARVSSLTASTSTSAPPASSSATSYPVHSSPPSILEFWRHTGKNPYPMSATTASYNRPHASSSSRGYPHSSRPSNQSIPDTNRRPSGGSDPSKPKLGLNHFELLYKTEGTIYVCRMCIQRRNCYHADPNVSSEGSKPPSIEKFKTSTKMDVLINHCMQAHPKACEDILKLKPSHIIERKQRMNASGGG